jgi:hypothetical protein
MKSSFEGTIESITAYDIDSNDRGCFISVFENFTFYIHADNNSFQDFQMLQKGKKYLFQGELTLYNPTFTVHKVIDDPQKMNSGSFMANSFNKNGLLFLTGKISQCKIIETLRQKKIAYAKFNDAPNLELIFYDMIKNCQKAFQNQFEISVIGEFNFQKPDFNIEQAEII